MSLLGKPVLFIATANADASRQFYENVLNLTCLSDDAFAIVFDLGPNSLRVQKVESLTAAGHTVLGWETDDIQASVETLAQRGVSFERFSQLPQNEQGVWTSPSGARIAWFKDPDGNTLSLTQISH